jgi:hypothetical protein
MHYKTRLYLNFGLIALAFMFITILFQLDREKRYKTEEIRSKLAAYSEMIDAYLLQNCDTIEVTHILPEDCVFTYYDEKGVCYCALEKAWREGKSSFIKPISCHLYPIRLSKLTSGVVALNYQQWHVCVPALAKGKTFGLPIYRFLREPLIRKFGQDWYDQLCEAAKMLEDYPRGV